MKKIYIVLLLALACRLVLVPLYFDAGVGTVNPSASYEYCELRDTVPHDIGYYHCMGERVLDGKSIYVNYSFQSQKYVGVIPYPMGYPLVLANTMNWVGRNYQDMVWLKLPAVFADLGVILLVYLIGLHLYDEHRALLAACLYAFSFLPLLSAGLLGNDDHVMLLFAMAAVYSVLKNETLWAGAVLGLAIFMKVSAILFLPPILFYLFRKFDLGGLFNVPFHAALWVCFLTLPYYLIDGTNALAPFNLKDSFFIGGFTVLNALRMGFGVPYDYVNGILLRDNRMDDPMNYQGSHWFMNLLKLLVFPLNLFAVGLCLYLFVKHKMPNKDLELVRNLYIFMLVFLVFSMAFFDLYALWFLPFLLLFAVGKPLSKKIEPLNISGFMLSFFGVLVYGLGANSLSFFYVLVGTYFSLATVQPFWHKILLVMTVIFMVFQFFANSWNYLPLVLVFLGIAYQLIKNSLKEVLEEVGERE